MIKTGYIPKKGSEERFETEEGLDRILDTKTEKITVKLGQNRAMLSSNCD